MTDKVISPPKGKVDPYIYLSVFTSGLVTLGAELSASRLIGNVFGSSNLIWANVIGLILLYITAGNFIGGNWADRSPNHLTMYKIMIWAAFTIALIPLLARPVLSIAAQSVVGAEAALAVGSFIGVLVLFSIPITLLGCISPFGIRLSIQDPLQAGKISGRIYAVSTLGSLIGTFLPVLILIPNLGTFLTFISLAGLLFVVGIVGLIRSNGMSAIKYIWMPFIVAIASLLVLMTPLRAPEEGAVLLYDDESAYNYIQVQEDAAGFRYLYLNEGQGVHSIWHPSDYIYGGTWDIFLAAPYFNTPPFAPEDMENLLVIGLAAGTIPRQYIGVYGDIPIDGIEIDPGVVEAGAKYFDMNRQQMPSLNVHIGDGRFVLNQLSDRYTVIAIDAYRPPYIPWHLTTVEFFEQVQNHLLPNGVVAINVGRTSTDRRLVDAMTATLMKVFPSVHAIDVPRSFNTILVGTMQPTLSSNLQQNFTNLPSNTSPILSQVLSRAVESVVPTQSSNLVFTDNRAPVERLVDSLVLNFLLYGDIDEIR